MFFFGRVITQARLECNELYIDAIVRSNYNMSFKAVSKEPAQDHDLGPFREISVDKDIVKSCASIFSPYHEIKLNNNTIMEVMEAAQKDDILWSYTAVLEGIGMILSNELAFNPDTSKRMVIERHLNSLGKLMKNLEEAKVLEDPALVLKRMKNPAKPIPP